METKTINDGVFVYGYQNRMDKMTPLEQSFNDVMKRQSQYDFLGHNKRTPDEERKVMKRISERVKKLRTTIMTLTLLIGMGLGMTSCNKDFNEPNPQLITQTFTLKTILTQEDPMTKGWDPALWVYQYSDTKFELKVSNAMNVYTRQVSVNEMLAGSVTFQLVPGLYSIDYSPVHTPRFDNKLDVSIHMTNMTIDGTPIILEGQLADALIILDLPGLTAVNMSTTGESVFNYDSRGFYYAYTNQAFYDDLDHGTSYTGLRFTFTDGSYKFFNLNPLSLGIVYWVQSNIGVQVQLIIPTMEIQTYILP